MSWIRRTSIVSTFVLFAFVCACSKQSPTANSSNRSITEARPDVDASQIVERYRALSNFRDSTIKMRATITNTGGEKSPARQVQLTIYRKREPNGRQLILIEFTSPVEERDRDGLITAFADGRIEAVRFVQSTDSFIVVNNPMNEDALFGLTPQELAEGQPEKYDFTVLGEEVYEGKPVYRLEGKLKQAAESKFPRMVLLISKQDFTALQAEFYNNQNALARRLDVLKTESIGGYPTRVRWSIENQARERKIDFEATDVKYDQNLPDTIFTREHLKKIASK